MDYWPHLPPVAQLPIAYRVWAWWLRHGPKRAEGTVAGSMLYRLLRRLSPGEHAYFTLRGNDHPALTIDLHDFESFHHAIPVWFRGDAELAILRGIARQGGTCIDVGANYGTYALHLAASAFARVVAVEPQPHLAEALRRSVATNGFANFEVVEAALADECGEARLALGTGSGSASLHHERFERAAPRVAVRTLTLDQLCRDLRIEHLRCLKLDVEGAEAAVVRGGVDTLRRERPFVLFEAGSSERQAEVFAMLRACGYEEFWDQSSAGSPVPVPPRLDEPLTNILAVPYGQEAGAQEMLASLER